MMKKLNPLLIPCLLFALAWPLSAKEKANLSDTIGDTLVRLENDQLVDAKDGLKGKDYIAVYYSASWCPPCQQFTPELVKFYTEQKEKNPNFEMILVSADQNEEAMKKYMSKANMEFLAVRFDDVKESKLMKHAARGIPYMVVLNADGKVIIQKPFYEDYMPPAEVLTLLEKLLNETS